MLATETLLYQIPPTYKLYNLISLNLPLLASGYDFLARKNFRKCFRYQSDSDSGSTHLGCSSINCHSRTLWWLLHVSVAGTIAAFMVQFRQDYANYSTSTADVNKLRRAQNPLSRHHDGLSAHSRLIPPTGFRVGKELNLRSLCSVIKSSPYSKLLTLLCLYVGLLVLRARSTIIFFKSIREYQVCSTVLQLSFVQDVDWNLAAV